MSLDLDDLSKDELDFVISLLRICCKCEKEIAITETYNGSTDCCGCLFHSIICPSPRIRKYHRRSECSLGSKKATIRGFLNNQDLSTVILQKLRDDCPNLLIVLDSAKIETETLNNEEILLLIRTIKICSKCVETISDTDWSALCCGCVHHSFCLSPKNRTDHISAICSYEFKAQTVKMLKDSINGNFGNFFQTYMIDNCPSLMKAIRSKNQIPAPPTQIDLFRQELYNAKQEILQANNEKKSLREELVKANQAVYKTKKKNETLQDELEQAIQALNNAKNEQKLNLEESKKRVADVEGEKDMLKHSLQLKKEENKQLNKELTQLRQELGNAKQEILEANIEKESLRDELRKANQAVHKTKKENESLQHGLEQANQALNNAKNEHRMNLEKSKKRLVDVEREKDMLEHSLQLKKEENKQLNKELTQISLKFLNLNVYYTADLQKETYCGHGSNGVVNIMDNPNGRGKLAIKRYRAGEPNMSLRDKNEIFHLLEVCNHKNFVRILGVLYENEQWRLNNPFPIGFVMEYMDGGTLSNLIHDLEKKYENVDIFNWIEQASEGLYYLHTKKIIHRDVKPDNMMLTNKNQTLKLCDLGLSRIQGSSNSLGKGTACYMAPELMKPEAEAIYDEKCDVYSLGVSMWEMVNREVPFKGVALFQISDRVLKKERPTIRKDCDSTLRMLITRSWEHEPQNRLTMTEIHEISTERWRTETAAQ